MIKKKRVATETICQAPALACLTQDGFGGTLQRATDTLNPTFA